MAEPGDIKQGPYGPMRMNEDGYWEPYSAPTPAPTPPRPSGGGSTYSPPPTTTTTTSGGGGGGGDDHDHSNDKDSSVFDGAAWKVPSDGILYDVTGVGKVLVFTVQAPNSDIEMSLVYAIDPEDEDKFDFSAATDAGAVGDGRFDIMYPNAIEGGNALELTGIEESATFADWFDDTWRRFVGYNPVLEQDPELAAIYTEALLEGWSDQEIQSAVSTTEWWQSASTEQRQYQLLSPDQQREKIEEQAGSLTLTYFTYMGQSITPTDPFVMKLAERVASGEISYAEATIEIQTLASKDPNTPFATQEREYNRRGVNIENKTGELRDTALQWGVRLDDKQLAKWAQRINDLDRSDEDFTLMLQDVAEAQWGSAEKGTSSRSRNTSVDVWASPYIASYSRLMEYGETTSPDLLFDDKFTSLLDTNMSVSEFEKAIRTTDDWRNTKNGKQASNEMLARVGQIMGFS